MGIRQFADYQRGDQEQRVLLRGAGEKDDGADRALWLKGADHHFLLQPSVCTLLQGFYAGYETGALVGNGGIANAGYYCKKFGFECYHPGIEGLTKEEVELCHKNGIEVNVWTINNMDDLENMYEWGCDGVITNYPDVCKSWLKAKKAKG